jgi:hypothetical protein
MTYQSCSSELVNSHAKRRSTVLDKLRRAVIETKELKDGYAYSFPADGQWLQELATMIELERRCCPFLQFRLTVEPNGGATWLELTGPEGTKDFLAATFN